MLRRAYGFIRRNAADAGGGLEHDAADARLVLPLLQREDQPDRHGPFALPKNGRDAARQRGLQRALRVFHGDAGTGEGGFEKGQMLSSHSILLLQQALALRGERPAAERSR